MKKVNLIIPVILSLVLFSCKKNTINTISNNPDITEVNFNISYDSSSISEIGLNINNDPVSDYYFYNSFSLGGEKSLYFDKNYHLITPYNEFLCDTTEIDASIEAYGLKEIANNTLIGPDSKLWFYQGFVYSETGVSFISTLPNNDQFIGIRFYISGQFHYGWIRVNFNNTTHTFKVIDGAYNTIPNTPIKAGEI